MMLRQNPCQATSFGYLSILESPEHGYFGGYLLVSPFGRPLEFHCTAPVRPSRAQQILYGPTLRSYVVGEQISGTLLAKSELAPQIVLTDQSATLYLRSQFEVPIVCWIGSTDSNAATTSDGPAIAVASGQPQFVHLEHTWQLPMGYDSDRESVMRLLSDLAKHVDLPEPFDRIHEAIREAQRLGEQGPEAYDQAA